MYIVLGIIFVVLGLLMLIRPEVIYGAVESWKSDTAGEPSKLYRFSTRFGGAMVLAVGILCFIAAFWPD